MSGFHQCRVTAEMMLAPTDVTSVLTAPVYRPADTAAPLDWALGGKDTLPSHMEGSAKTKGFGISCHERVTQP